MIARDKLGWFLQTQPVSVTQLGLDSPKVGENPLDLG